MSLWQLLCDGADGNKLYRHCHFHGFISCVEKKELLYLLRTLQQVQHYVEDTSASSYGADLHLNTPNWKEFVARYMSSLK
uniref:Uncharacterized protein n=1 Tax=Arion vulgaris TaxID=1028688 RepID=A0A0B6XWV2_9EUPU